MVITVLHCCSKHNPDGLADGGLLTVGVAAAMIEQKRHPAGMAARACQSAVGDVYGRTRSVAATRLGTITLRRKKQTSSPRWLNPRVSTVTTPRSGRLDDSRFSITTVSA